ncbi:MAG: rhomboid family intramembrane serine protease [Gemmatimonadota bacterium]
MTPWVARLLFANVGAFLLTTFAPALAWPLSLVPTFIPQRPWTPFTYMFLHAGFGHLLFNMLGLYFFGPRVEQRLGGRRFLGLYVVSGLVGALLSLATPYARIVGASGAVFGVMLGFARYWPREPIYLWGVFPVEARVLVVVTTVLALWGAFSGASGGIAHFAHLGGYLGGFVYLRWVEARSPAARFRAQLAPEPKRASDADLERWRRIDASTLHPVNREECERVMAKLDASGVGSLTPGEREFLQRFSAR